MKKSDAISILVVEDHPMFRAAIGLVLSGIAVRAQLHEAGSGESALALIEQVPNPDLVCLDLELPDVSGIEFLDELRRRKVSSPVLVISASEEPSKVNSALLAGARGYMSKLSQQQELEQAVRVVLNGGRYVSTRLRKSLDGFRAGLDRSAAGAIRLTRRQRQVLALVAHDASNIDIAKELDLAESTVKGHVSTLLDLLGAANRTSLAAEARNLGLLR